MTSNEQRGLDAVAAERPICQPISRHGPKTYLQVINLFQFYGLPAPPTELRDKLVTALEWAWYGQALDAALSPLPSTGKADDIKSAAHQAVIDCGHFTGDGEVERIVEHAIRVERQKHPAPSPQMLGDGEAAIIECLAAGKPFVFDPATNFLHADDGTVEYGIRYVPDDSQPAPANQMVVGQVDYPKILYVCEDCFEHNNEGCGNDRDRINVTPDGRWLCDDCRDGNDIDIGLCNPPPKLFAVQPSSQLIGWRQIDTCPRNQSIILQCWWKHQPTSPYVFEGYLDWDGVTWHEQNGELLRPDITDPAYWQPLPTGALSPATPEKQP